MPIVILPGSISGIVTELVLILAGGTLVGLTAILQQWSTGRREDQRRASDTKASRVQLERDVIGNLIAAMHGWASSVANLKIAYDQARTGLSMDQDRIRKFLADIEAFSAALAQARVSVQNPAARGPLEELRQQHVVMTELLNQDILGRPSPEFVKRFQQFQTVIAAANRKLEEAALRWDGSLES